MDPKLLSVVTDIKLAHIITDLIDILVGCINSETSIEIQLNKLKNIEQQEKNSDSLLQPFTSTFITNETYCPWEISQRNGCLIGYYDFRERFRLSSSEELHLSRKINELMNILPSTNEFEIQIHPDHLTIFNELLLETYHVTFNDYLSQRKPM
jgi:hypothetical protein